MNWLLSLAYRIPLPNSMYLELFYTPLHVGKHFHDGRVASIERGGCHGGTFDAIAEGLDFF